MPSNKKEYARKHYQENRQLYIERAAKAKRKAIQRNRQFIFNILKQNKCFDCHEDDPVVLEFDHRKSENKLGNIADLVRNGVSLNRLKSEVDKCEIRCANCHRRKTAFEEKWWIYDAG